MLKQQGKSTNLNIPHRQKCWCLAACRTEDAWLLVEEAVGCKRGGGRSAQGFPSLIFVLQSPSVKEGAWPGKNWSSWNPKAKIMLTSVGVGAGLQRMDKNSQIFLIRQLLPMYVVLISSHTWVIFAVIKKKAFICHSECSKTFQKSHIGSEVFDIILISWEMLATWIILLYKTSFSVRISLHNIYILSRAFFGCRLACHIKYCCIFFSTVFLLILIAKCNSSGNCSLTGKAVDEDWGSAALSEDLLHDLRSEPG